MVAAEVFPQHVRPASQAFVASSNWCVYVPFEVLCVTQPRTLLIRTRLFAFIIARFTPQMFLAMSYGAYLFFATFMIFSIAFVYVSEFATSLRAYLRLEEPR